jgi:hypothetical protein
MSSVFPHTHPIAFHVEDFEGAKTELESRGIMGSYL